MLKAFTCRFFFLSELNGTHRSGISGWSARDRNLICHKLSHNNISKKKKKTILKLLI